MSDDLKNKSQQDRTRVAGNETWELAYLKEKLGVTDQQIQEAIKQVGNNREKVEALLRGKNN